MRVFKIRKCLQLGINQQINSLASKINESNSATVSKFLRYICLYWMILIKADKMV